MTKLYKPVLIDSTLAATNIEKQRFIGFDGNYCQAGKKAHGVSDVEIEKGQLVPISVIGILLVEAGGAIPLGSKVTSDPNGKAVIATTNDEVNGWAVDTASTGEVIRIVRGI